MSACEADDPKPPQVEAEGKALLIDFGSTYTKVTAVDLEREQILGWAQALSTVGNDIILGLKKALSALKAQVGEEPLSFRHKLACSSARGGLGMVAIGLVPELTAEAARRAALGAGARILSLYSYKLTSEELAEIVNLSPDMVLLAGGTDGGDSRVILHNAKALARSRIEAPIVVAGNKETAGEIETLLKARNKKEVRVTENVMPRLNQLNVEPVRRIIRQLFIERIVEAKGFSKAERLIDGIVMPTPEAVLRAARLLAEGTEGEEGWGELMVVDVGGATTDVDSISKGEPTAEGILMRGLPEPYAKRTVEGDLGLRVSALSLLEAIGEKKLLAHIGAHNLNLPRIVAHLRREVGFIPSSTEEKAIDQGMAKAAVKLAVKRHVGFLREFYLPTGYGFIQEGKDLTAVKHLIGVGGIFCHAEHPGETLKEALFDNDDPFSLCPKNPQLWIDRRYILWAMGLLAEVAPSAALRIMKEYLEGV